jgi:hypothetical protein
MNKYLQKLFKFKNIFILNRSLRRKRILIGFSFFIILLNSFLYFLSGHYHFSNIQKRWDASGFSHEKGKHFFYFYYYKNLFPVAILGPKEYSEKGAEKALKERGNEVLMELLHWSRLGENAKIWAYYPSAILKGSPEKPSLKTFNALIFTLSILICFWGFYSAHQPLSGILLTLSINLTPFYLYEVFANENIFALATCSFLTGLGINACFIYRKVRRYHIFLLPVITGISVAFFSEMRAEFKTVFISMALIYILSRKLKLTGKILALLLLGLSFYSARELIRLHFDRKFLEAQKVVEQIGGHVYKGGRLEEHRLWHNIFCGLGDFGYDKNYKWDDRSAYIYAFPLLNKIYNNRLNYDPNKYHLDNFYDKAGVYYLKFDEIDEYEEIVKNKVLDEIRSDPIWYAGIICKRIWLLLTKTAPFHYLGLTLIPFFFLLLYYRRFRLLTILISSLPLSASAVIVYSKRGITYSSVFPHLLLLFLLLLLIETYLLHRKEEYLNNANG